MNKLTADDTEVVPPGGTGSVRSVVELPVNYGLLTRLGGRMPGADKATPATSERSVGFIVQLRERIVCVTELHCGRHVSRSLRGGFITIAK
mgnify:CR=1 FL=1